MYFELHVVLGSLSALECILRVCKMENLLCDLSDVLSVLPAGEHVSECKWLQSGMNQVGFRRLLLILCCGDREQKFKMAQISLSNTFCFCRAFMQLVVLVI